MTDRQAHMLRQHMGDRSEAELLLAAGGGWEYDDDYAAAPGWHGGQPHTVWVCKGYRLFLVGMCTFQLYKRDGVKVDGCRGTRNLHRLLARAVA